MYGGNLSLEKSIVPVDGKTIENISLRNKEGKPSEEYYKWQFIYSLINSGLYSKDYIGAEIYFPKGNKNSAPIKIDSCIFDSRDWVSYYQKWRNEKDDDAVEWLRKHMIGAIEYKKSNGRDIKKVFTSQIKPYIKESEKQYCLGFYYDFERLYLFQKKNGKILRYDESKNLKGDKSGNNELSLELTDAYSYIPSFDELLSKINKPLELDRSKRTVKDLDLITGVRSSQINTAISNMLKQMDKVSMVNQRGYEILIQLLALKIFDEKRSMKMDENLKFYQTQEEERKLHLLFYITPNEKEYINLSDDNIQFFIKRIRKLYTDAELEYKVILKPIDNETINWKNENHIRVISAVVENLQDYSFVKSTQSDLYQLVFYRFANEFAKSVKGQFLTPLKLIDFLVKLVNPKNWERVIDPTVGIADFLSFCYVNSKGTLEDKNIYGIDNDESMVMLAKLNMLLNGDGNANIMYSPDMGSLLNKFDTSNKLVQLDTKLHKNGNWDNWADQTKLMKFNVVLTNPPFGENRKFEAKTQREKEVAELYETWHIGRNSNSIDMGILFLENAYRVLDENGRMGIVLSNSIASVDRWEKVRKWALREMRIVALFDLPANVFADTGVNTTILVAYKPPKDELERLQKSNYEIFVRNIKNIGYEVKTIKRVKTYIPIYKTNDHTFDIQIDENGNPLLDEDFTLIINDFKEWANGQEEKLKELFL
jgi:type I restriction enzyme M protein